MILNILPLDIKINNGFTVIWMCVSGGDRVVFPISFSAHYSSAGLLIGEGGAGIIQCCYQNLSGFNVYCRIATGGYFNDEIYIICVGI